MTDQANNTAAATRESNLPGYVVKTREGRGKNATYERIGVAWENEDGSFYVRLHGTQIIERGFTLYKVEQQPEEQAGT